MKKDVTELKKMFLEVLQNPQKAAAASNFAKESLMNDYQTLTEMPKARINQPAIGQAFAACVDRSECNSRA